MRNCLNYVLALALSSILSGIGGGEFCVAYGHSSTALQTVCKGKVTDVTNQPIIGVSVIIKGTKKGVITDFNGEFSLSGLKEGDVLEFSCIGYESSEVVFKGDNSILNVTLKEDSKLLDEVVVVGYGVQKKVNVTGAVATIDTKVLEARPVQNISQALQGQIPGLNFAVNNLGGALGNKLNFNIRGEGTIGAGSSGSPLVLIDGIEGDLSLVNINDVENISILKDASSSSIYGARAAFGVILVTTKNGKSGKARVNYDGNIRWASATNLPVYANSLDFANYFNAAKINNGQGPLFNDEAIQNIKDFMAGKFTDPSTPEYYGMKLKPDGWSGPYTLAFANTDWFDVFYAKNVPSYENNVSISGGGDKLTYHVSANLLNQRGLLKLGKDTYDRLGINARFQLKLTDWASLNYTAKWSREKYSRPSHIEDQNGVFFHNITRRWVTNPVHINNGHYLQWMEIYELLDGGINNNLNNTIVNQAKLILTPLKGLQVAIDGSLRQRYKYREVNILPYFEYKWDGTPVLGKGASRGPDFTGRVKRSMSQDNYYAFNAVADYTASLANHNFKATLGMNTELFEQKSLLGSAQNLITSSVPEISTAQDDFKSSNGKNELAIAGFFGRLNYDYKGRYLLEGNIRYDGSSRFLGNKRWGLFKSMSLGWNIAKEEFFDFSSYYINTFKIRASYGELGNNTTDSWYPFFQTMEVGKQDSSWLIDGNKKNTSKVPGLVNNNLTWETVSSWNLGLDYGFFNDRLTGSFEVYNRYTYNMVGPAPTLPGILGTAPSMINNVDLKSFGWEMEIQWRDNIADFNYGIRATLSDSRRMILRYPNETKALNKYRPGEILGEIWGYETVGIASSLDEMNKHLEKNKPDFGDRWSAGDVMYKDLTNDGHVNSGANTLDDHGDLKIIGNSTPRYAFGINIDASWKGFDFSMFLQGIGKRDWLFGEGDPYFWGAIGDQWQSAAFVEHMDYWTPQNTNAYYPRPIFGSGAKNQKPQTRYLQDASYMRIKNIQFGYTLPQKYTGIVGISKARVYISADNLYTFTKMRKMFDPEALGGQWGSGRLYPLQRTISIGANINF